MDMNRLTEKSQDAIRLAQSHAVQNGNQQVDVEHLLLAMLEQEGGLAPSILLRADVRLEALHKRLQQESQKRQISLADLCKMLIESEDIMGGK